VVAGVQARDDAEADHGARVLRRQAVRADRTGRACGNPRCDAAMAGVFVASQVLAAGCGLVLLEGLRGAPLCGQTLIGSVVERVAIGCVVLTTRGSAFDTQ